MNKQITRSQFELAIKAVTNGIYYSAFPDKKDGIQELAIEDLKDLSDARKEKYMTLREFGKDLYLTYPKGTEVDDIIMEYVDSVFDFIKDNEEEERTKLNTKEKVDRLLMGIGEFR